MELTSSILSIAFGPPLGKGLPVGISAFPACRPSGGARKHEASLLRPLALGPLRGMGPSVCLWPSTQHRTIGAHLLYFFRPDFLPIPEQVAKFFGVGRGEVFGLGLQR